MFPGNDRIITSLVSLASHVCISVIPTPRAHTAEPHARSIPKPIRHAYNPPAGQEAALNDILIMPHASNVSSGAIPIHSRA